MKGGKFIEDLAKAMAVKPNVVRKYLDCLEKLLVAQIKETGCAKVPRMVMFKKTLKTARPAQERKVFGKMTKIPARPEQTVYKALVAKSLRDQL